jgi:hypothetical protein
VDLSNYFVIDGTNTSTHSGNFSYKSGISWYPVATSDLYFYVYLGSITNRAATELDYVFMDEVVSSADAWFNMVSLVASTGQLGKMGGVTAANMKNVSGEAMSTDIKKIGSVPK